MILKSFGDSFIFGTDLPDANDGSDSWLIKPSQKTWPACLAQHLNCDYECFAFPGIGNLQILEKVLSQAHSDPAVFVVSWTWIDRFDYKTQYQREWKTIRPTSNSSESEYYYKNLHSQFTDKLHTLIKIKLAIDTLKQHGHKIIMTYMDDLIFETKWHTNDVILNLQKSVKPYMTTFDGLTFVQWAQNNSYEINKTLHPMEDAHRDAAKLLISQGLL